MNKIKENLIEANYYCFLIGIVFAVFLKIVLDFFRMVIPVFIASIFILMTGGLLILYLTIVIKANNKVLEEKKDV